MMVLYLIEKVFSFFVYKTKNICFYFFFLILLVSTNLPVYYTLYHTII